MLVTRATGSSPRLWGTQELQGFWTDIMRFIPTPVGNTFILSMVLVLFAVHPHACGEHTIGTVEY